MSRAEHESRINETAPAEVVHPHQTKGEHSVTEKKKSKKRKRLVEGEQTEDIVEKFHSKISRTEPASEIPEEQAPDVASPHATIGESATTDKKKSKKRKRQVEEERIKDIESRYMEKIYSKILKPGRASVILAEPPPSSDPIDPELIQHETLTPTSDDAEKTIFISNVPVKVLTSKSVLHSLKQLFSKHGKIKSIRFRSIAFTELVPRKVAYITKNFHPERDTLNAYIVYKLEESVQGAVEGLDGFLWEGKHLRVDSVSNPSVFPVCFCLI